MPAAASSTGALDGRIDAATLAIILEELRRTDDRDTAIRLVAQLYSCHWEAAAHLVARIERRYPASQRQRSHWPLLLLLVALLGVILLFAFVAWLRVQR